MIRNYLLIVLATLTTLTFSGCSWCETIVEVPKPYAVPTPCEVPKVNCKFSGDGSEPVVRLLECIVEQKKAMEVCQ